jgi:hypothetical protein
MTAQKRQKHVIIFAATALFLYQYLGRLETAVGPDAQKAFEIVRRDLKRALAEVGVDADAQTSEKTSSSAL